mmetsp:Transcript_33770/g.95556  ORF Transcript_33770/g.95556 Transcript_33770/m.95556 type:complete len:119 (+) Transcript_33770:463-819(+)
MQGMGGGGWFVWFVEEFYMDWTHPPTAVELRRIRKTFARCGFPGAVSSQEGVHTAWDNAPSQDRYLYSGKEGYPTLVRNVNVTHSRIIMNIHGPFAGGRNDKTIVRDDSFINMLKDDP